MKKLFIGSGLLLFLTVVFLVIYNFVFKKPANVSEIPEANLTQEEQDNITEKSATPIATEQKITRLSATPLSYPTLVRDEQIRFYRRASNTIGQLTIRGTSEATISATNSTAVRDVDWNSTGDLALLSKTDGSKYSIVDLANQSVATFAPQVDYATWSDDPDRVFYKSYNESSNSRTLGVIGIDGSNDTPLTTIPFRRVPIMDVPKSILVAYWPESDAVTRGTLYTVGTISPGDPKLVFDQLFGADYLYSPTGNLVAASGLREEGVSSSLTLGVFGKDGDNYTDFKIPTFASKTVWGNDGTTLYYALPTDIPEDSILPNDYARGSFFTQDTFWKVDTATGKKDRLIDLSDLPEKIDATNLFLNDEQTALFFLNRSNNILYRLNL